MKNPCDAPLLSKAFKTPKQVARRILDREIVEELIYNTQTLRDRLILELQARCGLRIGEALKIKVSDVMDRKLVLNEPKSGKELEVAFMPEQIAKRLHATFSRRILLLRTASFRFVIPRPGRWLSSWEEDSMLF